MHTALIAFDSAQLNTILQKMMDAFGFKTITTQKMSDVWDFFKENQSGLILTDWVLDKQETLPLLSQLLPEQHVIFVSAEKTPQKVLFALQSGVSEYIMKPFDNDILQSKLSMIGLL